MSYDIVNSFAIRCFLRGPEQVTKECSLILAEVDIAGPSWYLGKLGVEVGKVEQCGIVVISQMESHENASQATSSVPFEVS